MPKVSVVIPCFNMGQYLNEAVGSVLDQSFEDFEIIIVNDGSTDEFTKNLLETYSKPKTRILHTENHGVIAARNIGIRSAKGEYISCLDADDQFHPDYLLKCMTILEKDRKGEIGFVTTQVQVFGENSFIWECGIYNPYLLFIQNMVHAASLFRRKCWEDVGECPPDPTSYEDWNFWLSIVAKGYRWELVREPLFYYRDRPGSRMKEAENEKLILKEKINRNHLPFIKENILEILSAYDTHIVDMAQYYATSQSYIEALQKESPTVGEWLIACEERLKKANWELESIYGSRTFRLASLFREAGMGWRQMARFPFRLCWFFFTEKMKNRLRPLIRRKNFVKDAVGHCKHIRNVIHAPLLTVIIETDTFSNPSKIEFLSDIIKKQTFQKIELLLPISSSDEGVFSQLEEFKGLHEAIVSIPSSNCVPERRNQTVRNARGRYFCFLNSDVVDVSPSFFEKALYYLEKYHFDVVFTSTQYACGCMVPLVADHPSLDKIAQGGLITKSAVFRKEAWNNIGGFRLVEPMNKNSECEWDFWIRLFGKGFHFHPIPEILMTLTSPLMDSPSKDQQERIRKFNESIFSEQNLANLQDSQRIEYRVENPFINLQENDRENSKRILLVLPFLLMGGADTVLLSMVRYLSEEGYEFFIVTTLHGDPKFGDNTEKYEAAGSAVYHLTAFLNSEAEYETFILYLIKVKNIDILLQVGSELLYKILPRIKTEFPGIRVVDLLFNEHGHIKNNRKNCKHIDLNIAENRWVAKALKEAYGEKAERIKVIPNGVDVIHQFSPENISIHEIERVRSANGIPDKKFVVSFFGRFSEEKHPEFFVELAKGLREDRDLFFIAAGQGPLLEPIQSLLNEYRLHDTVLLPGIVDTKVFLAFSDVVVLPSKIDGRPNIVLESLSMGVPVIATKVGGVPELITDGETGFLCEVEDIECFIKKILSLKNNPDYHFRMKERARKYAVSHFDVRRMNITYHQLFESLLAKSN